MDSVNRAATSRPFSWMRRITSGRSEGAGAMVGTAHQLPEAGEKLAAEAELVADEIGFGGAAQREFGSRHQHLQRSGIGVEADDVAVVKPGDRPVLDRFRCHM